MVAISFSNRDTVVRLRPEKYSSYISSDACCRRRDRNTSERVFEHPTLSDHKRINLSSAPIGYSSVKAVPFERRWYIPSLLSSFHSISFSMHWAHYVCLIKPDDFNA